MSSTISVKNRSEGRLGDIADVRRMNQVRRGSKGMVRRQRLLVVDVHCGAQPSFAQGGEQCRLVDQWPSAGVDEQRAGLHQGELPGAEESVSALGEAYVQGHHVRGGKQ